MELCSVLELVVGRGTVVVALLSLGPVLLSLCAGLTVSVFQSVTQIQEQTLSFLPKVLTVSAGMFFFGGWALEQLVTYFRDILLILPEIGLGG